MGRGPNYPKPIILREVVIAAVDEHGRKVYIIGKTGPNTNIVITTEKYGGTVMGHRIRVEDLVQYTIVGEQQAQPALEQIRKAVE